MKALVTGLLLLIGLAAGAQSDTTWMNAYQAADTLFGKMRSKAPNGFLFNRLIVDDSVTTITEISRFFQNDTAAYRAHADAFYGALYELKVMALDSQDVTGSLALFDTASRLVAKHEFEDEWYVYPLGILDYRIDSVDLQEGVSSGILSLEQQRYEDLQPFNQSIVHERYVQFAAPLFDLHSSETMGLVFSSAFFFSNYRTVEDIRRLEIRFDAEWITVSFDEIVPFEPLPREDQEFTLRVTYDDGESMVSHARIHTPEYEVLSRSAHLPGADFVCGSIPWSPGCEACGEFTDIFQNKLKWCYIPSCSNDNGIFERSDKPYILVTGYRPPIFGQSFRKSWKLYSTHHSGLLHDLRQNDFDIYIVKFNINMQPYFHGMQESADLLVRFIEELNAQKGDDGYNENIIQGSSMGAEIARLALMRMERRHWNDPDYPHHHTRLMISYDANFYGANIPLAYQYQIYSGFRQPAFNANPWTMLPVSLFLSTFLYSTMEQKTVKELLMYHACASDEHIFASPHYDANVTPAYHANRQQYYDALEEVNTGKYFIPLPAAPRHIAISLGKISGVNSLSNTNDRLFKPAGQYWRDQNILTYRSSLRSAIDYSPNEYTMLFRRKKIGFSSSIGVNHKISVNQMEEIDNAAGSYLSGMGNIIGVTDLAYFPVANAYNGKNVFAHKPVITALAIHPDLWPADGSFTVNVKTLGLMFNEFNFDSNNPADYSDHFGYPNLGRPSDHFEVTPFEAIYIDKRIDPHIVLESSDVDDLDQLNGFIYNEVEPWYLGLQNQVVGSQARSSYTYKIKRRARYAIVAGHTVTPTTDPGDYILDPNSDAIIEAGREIHLYPGVHIKEGAAAHLRIHYELCEGGNLAQQPDDPTNESAVPEDRDVIDKQQTPLWLLYPNPSDAEFSIAAMDSKPLEDLEIYDLSGNLVYAEVGIDRLKHIVNPSLKKGIYILIVRTRTERLQTKLIRL